mmetsp:Transcript_70351/g.161412  ORF Transcript_70351/g.161412 Transcript_70351/m.161412 type:complete len:233 (+) Transcript_70351:36-734(+)
MSTIRKLLQGDSKAWSAVFTGADAFSAPLLPPQRPAKVDYVGPQEEESQRLKPILQLYTKVVPLLELSARFAVAYVAALVAAVIITVSAVVATILHLLKAAIFVRQPRKIRGRQSTSTSGGETKRQIIAKDVPTSKASTRTKKAPQRATKLSKKSVVPLKNGQSPSSRPNYGAFSGGAAGTAGALGTGVQQAPGGRDGGTIRVPPSQQLLAARSQGQQRSTVSFGATTVRRF